MSSPGLTRRERDVRSALNACRPRAARWSPPAGIRLYGIVVHPATIRSPWIRSRGARRPSRYSHRPTWALIAWDRGVPAGALVQFACGQYSNHPTGEIDPSGIPCPQCLLRTGEATICPKEPQPPC